MFCSQWLDSRERLSLCRWRIQYIIYYRGLLLQIHCIQLKFRGVKAASIILSGESGCGKTLFINIMAEILKSDALFIRKKQQLEDFLESSDHSFLGNLIVLIDNFDQMKDIDSLQWKIAE